MHLLARKIIVQLKFIMKGKVQKVHIPKNIHLIIEMVITTKNYSEIDRKQVKKDKKEYWENECDSNRWGNK